MQDHQEEWLKLCEQAAIEQDPQKLFQLVRRINELLEAKEKRLQARVQPPSSSERVLLQTPKTTTTS